MNDYCHPNNYKGLPNSLFRNEGNGTFTDVSKPSGLRAVIGKGMGLGVPAFDRDGFTDVFVSNDTEPNYLFRNLGNGTFEELGFMAGVAYPAGGPPLSGMVARASGDVNNDGRKDLFVAGGDVMDPNGEFREKVRQTNLVMANLGQFKFAQATAGAGADFSTKRGTHRGGAFGDLDNDGRVDAIVTALDEALEVWRNVSPAANRWLSIRTIGTKSNRDGMGAEITLTPPSGA